MRRAPRLAIALLARLSADDALVGDLAEEFRAGRSRGWFWRQVLGALLVFAREDLRRHWIVAVRGLLVAWAVLQMLRMIFDWVWVAVLLNPMLRITDRLFHEAAFNAPLLWIRLIVWCPAAVFLGWIVCLVHPRSQRMTVLIAATLAGIVWASFWLLELTWQAIAHPSNPYWSVQLEFLVGTAMLTISAFWLGALMAMPLNRSASTGLADLP